MNINSMTSAFLQATRRLAQALPAEQGAGRALVNGAAHAAQGAAPSNPHSGATAAAGGGGNALPHAMRFQENTPRFLLRHFHATPAAGQQGGDAGNASAVLGRYASLYGPRGEQLNLQAKIDTLKRDPQADVLLKIRANQAFSQTHRMLTGDANCRQHMKACLDAAAGRGERVNAAVIGAAEGEDAFNLAFRLQTLAKKSPDDRPRVFAIDADPNAVQLMKLAKGKESADIRKDIGAGKGSPQRNLQHFDAIRDTIPIHKEADAALDGLRQSGHPVHLVTAASTFSYLPNLGATLAKIHGALPDKGMLMFDVYGDRHDRRGKEMTLYAKEDIRQLVESKGFSVVHQAEEGKGGGPFHRLYIGAVKNGDARA